MTPLTNAPVTRDGQERNVEHLFVLQLSGNQMETVLQMVNVNRLDPANATRAGQVTHVPSQLAMVSRQHRVPVPIRVPAWVKRHASVCLAGKEITVTNQYARWGVVQASVPLQILAAAPKGSQVSHALRPCALV